MPDIKNFEDQFDHDPNSSYEEEEELDLGPDDEFAEPSASQRPLNGPRKRDLPEVGCLGGVFKIFLSLALIAGFVLYLFYPKIVSGLRDKAKTEVSESDAGFSIAPVETKTAAAPVAAKKAAAQPKTERSVPKFDNFIKKAKNRISGQGSVGLFSTDSGIFLPASGRLPDFRTAVKNNPVLAEFLTKADHITYDTLDTHHDLVKNLIAEWAGETDETKIAQIIQQPYNRFFRKTSAFLLSQTLLKQKGLAPVDFDRISAVSPNQIMAGVYPSLRAAMASKTSLPSQLQTVEPVSSFFIHICNDDPECMSSWDLLMEMLDIKRYAKRLEKAPETIYMRQ